MATSVTTQNSNGAQKLTANQRAALFSAATRQHFQMIGTQKVSGGAQSITFRVPKARILQGIRLYVEYATDQYDATYTSMDPFKVYDCIRRISIDLNNGFAPIVASGREVAMMNTLYPHGEMVVPKKAGEGVTLASFNDDSPVTFMLDLPLTLNYRDTSGLILAQNQETSIDVVIDIDNASATNQRATSYTDFTISAMTTSYSVPAKSEWFPDLSILKILDSRKENFTAGGSYVKLPTGMIYRKMILIFAKEDGSPMSADEITSNIEIVMNTADIPYSISPKMLKKLNLMQCGVDLPKGCYFFSFDWQGIIGMGGSRDYIDAERISELAIRFNSSIPGKLTVVSEKISRLIAG